MNNIETYLEEVVRQKMFRLNDSVTVQKLAKTGILTEDHKVWILSDRDDTIKKLYESLLKTLEIPAISILDDLNKHIADLVESYRKEGITQGLTQVKRNLKCYCIRELIDQTTIVPYILSVKKDFNKRDIFHVSDGFFNHIDLLDLSANDILNATEHIISEIWGDGAVSYATKGMVLLGESKPDLAKETYKISLNRKGKINALIRCNLLLGLNASHSSWISSQLRNVISGNGQLFDFALFFTKVDNPNIEELESTYNALKQMAFEEDFFVNNLIGFKLCLLKHSISDAIKEEVTLEAKSLLRGEETEINVSSTILNNLWFLKLPSSTKLDLINEIHPSALKNVHHVLCHVLIELEIKDAFSFIRRIVEITKLQFDAHYFEYFWGRAEREKREEFEDHFLKFFLEEKGIFRFAASRILSELDNWRFSKETLLGLIETKQHQYCATVLYDISQPKSVFPLVIELRNSQYEFIRVFLIEKFKEYLWNYSITVIDELKLHLSESDAEDIELLSEIMEEDKIRNEYLNKKRSIKELNPYYNFEYSDYLKYHKLNQEKYNDFFSESMNDHEKNSFLSVISKVTIARGGGWRRESDEGIQRSPLNNVSLGGLQFSRDLMLDSSRFNWDMKEFYITDWNKLGKDDE